MKKILLLLAFTSFQLLSSQINVKDSSFQAIGYWDLNETQKYKITHSKYKVVGIDSTLTTKIEYDLNIKITDSTAKSYTIEWEYLNFKTNLKNPFISKMLGINEFKKIVFKTDEMGSFQEIVNSEELEKGYKKSMALLKKEFSGFDKEASPMLKQLEALYANKASIENGATKDIKQFYNFHGGAYTLNEVLEGDLKVDNLFGGEPFDAKVYVELTDIYNEDEYVILMMEQYVDKQQLSDVIVDVGQSLTNKKISEDLKKDIENIEHSIILTSSIHSSGWPLYSMQVTEVNIKNKKEVEIREIEIIIEEE